jgi:hypothetical protein
MLNRSFDATSVFLVRLALLSTRSSVDILQVLRRERWVNITYVLATGISKLLRTLARVAADFASWHTFKPTLLSTASERYSSQRIVSSPYAVEFLQRRTLWSSKIEESLIRFHCSIEALMLWVLAAYRWYRQAGQVLNISPSFDQWVPTVTICGRYLVDNCGRKECRVVSRRDVTLAEARRNSRSEALKFPQCISRSSRHGVRPRPGSNGTSEDNKMACLSQLVSSLGTCCAENHKKISKSLGGLSDFFSSENAIASENLLRFLCFSLDRSTCGPEKKLEEWSQVQASEYFLRPVTIDVRNREKAFWKRFLEKLLLENLLRSTSRSTLASMFYSKVLRSRLTITLSCNDVGCSVGNVTAEYK